ncbi:MAG: ABC transporter substrate-binding protein [Anaerocolumna sp.]
MKRCYTILSIFIVFITIINLCGCSEKEKATSVRNNGNTEKMTSVSNDTDSIKTITDMGGRKVEISDKIGKVYGANPMSTILLFTLVPDKIIAWNTKLPNQNVLPEKYRNLPVAGSMGTKQQAASPEEILAHNPDMVIFAQTEINEQGIDKADKLSKQLGKPVVLVNGSFENMESTYELLGQIFDCSERSNELIQYYKDTLSNIENIKSEIKEEDKVKVYYGKEADALTTSGNQSVHAKLIQMVGGVNAAGSIEGSGDAAINMEDVIKWQPDVILLSEANDNEKDSSQNLKKSNIWKGITAVENGKVYVSPQLIFSWFDRPPSINELIGIKWLAQTLYPSYYNLDIRSEIKDFYKEFYNIDLKDGDVNKILAGE